MRRSLRLGLEKLREEKQWHLSTSNLFIILELTYSVD